MRRPVGAQGGNAEKERQNEDDGREHTAGVSAATNRRATVASEDRSAKIRHCVKHEPERRDGVDARLKDALGAEREIRTGKDGE